MRFVIANVLLFAAYTGLSMIGTWIYVRGGQDSNVIVILDATCQSSAVPVTCVVNWWLLRMRNPAKRILTGIGVGLLACACAFVPYVLIKLYFHLAIGGTL